MRTLISLLAAFLLFPCLIQAQTKKVIVVIGSSTAAGAGASDGHGWVDLVDTFYNNLGLLKEPIHKLALSGATTYNAMPNGYVAPVFPDGIIRDTVDTARNVTKALSFHPDIVIVAYPGNDLVKGYSLNEFLSNLQTIYNIVTANGAVCWITSSQPRDYDYLSGRQQFQTADTRIMAQFPVYGIEFFHVLADLNPGPHYLYIKTDYDIADDGIHVNNAGHAALAATVENANVIGSTPLPLTLLSFTATGNGQTGVLRWTTTEESGSNYFIIQRSADGATFEDLARVEAMGNSTQTDYSWIDQHPLTGKSFYRLKMVEDGKETYSRIAGRSFQPDGLNINKLYLSGGSELQAEISFPHDQPLMLTITNTAGVTVRQQTVMGQAPAQKIRMSTAGLAAGQYFLKITAASGQYLTRAFLTF